MGTKWLKTRIVAWAAICLFAAAGCGTPDGDAEGNGPLSDTLPAADFATEVPGDASDAPTEPAAEPRGLRAELEALGGTDVIGTVRLSPGQGGTAVSVEIHGANSGLPYVAELVGGSCQSPANTIAVLGQITAGEEGDGEFHEVIDPSLLGSDQASRAVRVRGAESSAIVACGNLGDVEATPATGR